MTSSSMIVLMLFAVQFAVFCFLGVESYKPRSLAVKSPFIQRNRKHIGSGKVQHCAPSPTHCRSSSFRDAYSSILSIRGGSYEDYNDGYGYNDDKGYNDDYRHNDYGQGDSYGRQSDRYQDDYYPQQGRGDGYYDDEGRYHEDYDDRGAGRSVSTLDLVFISIG